jgi:hypothetical protein
MNSGPLSIRGWVGAGYRLSNSSIVSITPAVRKVVDRAFDHAGAQGDEQCGVAARLSTLTSGRG